MAIKPTVAVSHGPGSGAPDTAPRGKRKGPLTPPSMSGQDLANKLEAARKDGTLHKLVGREEAAKFGSGPFSANIAELKKTFGSSDIRGLMGDVQPPRPIAPPPIPRKGPLTTGIPPVAGPGAPPAARVPVVQPPAPPPAAGTPGGGTVGTGGAATAAAAGGPMTGLQAALGGELPPEAGYLGAAPGRLRQGMGQRTRPQDNPILAGLGHLY